MLASVGNVLYMQGVSSFRGNVTGVDGKAVNQRVPAGQFMRMEIGEPMGLILVDFPINVLGDITNVGDQIVLIVIGIWKARRLVPLFRQM